MTDPTSPDPDLLALLGHELRTPLNAIIGYADAMRTQTFGPLNPPYDRQAEIIHRAALHLLAVIDGLAAVPHPEGGPWITRVERFEVGPVVRGVVDLLSPGSAISIEVYIDPGVVEVVSDQRALAQILVNLIDNARKHGGAGSPIRVHLTKEGANLRLMVASTAVAPSARLGRREGGGLGLRLVRGLCAGLAGEFTLEEGPRGDYTALATLPAFPEA